MLPTLYDLAAEYAADLEKLANLDLPEETVKDTLDSMGGELQAKAQNIAGFVKHLETLTAGIKDAERQMAEKRKRLEARIDRLKQYTLDTMVIHGIQKIETPYFTLSVAKNPYSVEVFDEDMIPAHFLRQPPLPMPVPDKAAIKESIEAGEDVPGCRLNQSLRLSIK